MDVYEAVTSPRAMRGFTDEPVSKVVLERVLSAAARSPSASNIQPWNIYVLTGAPLAELKTRAVERVAYGDPWDERQYEMYPPALKSPYGERRSTFGKERGRGGPVTLGRAHPLLRHVDRVHGPHGELPPYGPRPETVTFVDG